MSRYRQTMAEAYGQVQQFESTITKLKNGVKVLGGALPNKALAQKMADKANKEMGHDADVYQSPFNNRFYVRIKEELEESFSDAMIAKLKKEYEPLRNKKISIDNANKLGALFTKFDKDKNALEKLYGGDIPFISTMAMTRLMTKHNYTASKINALRKEELEILEEVDIILEGQGTIKGFRNDKEKSNMVSLAKQHGLKVQDVAGGIQLTGNMRKILDMQLAAQGNGLKAEEVNEGKMSEIDAMQKAGKSAAEIAKALKLPVNVVKGILGEKVVEEVDENAPSAADLDRLKKMGMKPKKEEEEEEKKPEEKEEKKDDSDKLKSEIEKKDDEIAMLKQKAETEKAKVAKKETEKLVNPETGEPLLQVGIAYKHLKDKMKKDKEEVKEASDAEKSKAYAIGMSVAKKKYNDEPPLDKKTITKGHEIADKILKKEETIVEFTTQQIKMAYGVANDKRYKAGNYSGAVAAIEKIAKGLSKHPDVAKVLKRVNENKEHPAKEVYESIEAVKNKAEKSGMPYSILKKVYDRGMAAWRGGHRPGATQVQWALARVNSFVTKSSGTWGGADKDLAAKVKGE